MKNLAVAAVLVMCVFAAGCSGTDDEPKPSPSAASEADGPTEEQQRAFVDNLAVFRALAAGSPDAPESWQAEPEGGWDELSPEARQQQVDFGLEACEQPPAEGGAAGASGPVNTDLYMPWLAAKFLCPDRLDEAEKALRDDVQAQTMQAFELSLLHDDARADDVLTALTLCEAELEMSWEIPEGMWNGYFCWIMRINAISENKSEQDFIAMFQTDGETSADFDELAEAMGATPGGLGGLLEGVE